MLIVIAVKMPKNFGKEKPAGREGDASARRVAKQLSTMRGKGGEFTIVGPWCHAGVSNVAGSPTVIGIVEAVVHCIVSPARLRMPTSCLRWQFCRVCNPVLVPHSSNLSVLASM